MKFLLISAGKKDDADMAGAVSDYTKRLSRYAKTEWKIVPSSEKGREAEAILKNLTPGDFLVALDETGKEMSTAELSRFIEKRMLAGDGRMVFAIGGAYGLDERVLKRANFAWSLSKLTFPHRLVRLILAETLYRAMSVLKGEPYHHA